MNNDEFLSEIPSGWIDFLRESEALYHWQKIKPIVDTLYRGATVFPPRNLLFNALHLTPVDELKCVIVGQDPYHGFGQANGLAFSVNKGVKAPPSLQNLLKELVCDMGLSNDVLSKSDLTPWAKQGVLLLNRSLTVEEKKPNSHADLGWGKFTESVIFHIAETKPKIVFILLGNSANKLKDKLLDCPVSIITAAHPSPLSAYRGFFGSRIFSKTNQQLIHQNIPPIDWEL